MAKLAAFACVLSAASMFGGGPAAGASFTHAELFAPHRTGHAAPRGQRALAAAAPHSDRSAPGTAPRLAAALQRTQNPVAFAAPALSPGEQAASLAAWADAYGMLAHMPVPPQAHWDFSRR